MQTKKAAPFGITNNTQEELQPITSITKDIYKMPESSCALARQNQRSIWFCLDFLLLLFFVSRQKK
jgi:hypothetical protein